MPPNHNQRVGRWGEDLAARYLEGKGYCIVARNVRTPGGELDLVTRLPQGWVFVEVKTRTNQRYGYPEISVTPRKLAHLVAAVQHFLVDYEAQHPDDPPMQWQVDIIAVQQLTGQKEAQIEHFEHITA